MQSLCTRRATRRYLEAEVIIIHHDGEVLERVASDQVQGAVLALDAQSGQRLGEGLVDDADAHVGLEGVAVGVDAQDNLRGRCLVVTVRAAVLCFCDWWLFKS